jgi:hypothetical protein
VFVLYTPASTFARAVFRRTLCEAWAATSLPPWPPANPSDDEL